MATPYKESDDTSVKSSLAADVPAMPILSPLSTEGFQGFPAPTMVPPRGDLDISIFADVKRFSGTESTKRLSGASFNPRSDEASLFM